MNESIERSVKDRLKMIASEEEKPFRVLWGTLAMERFLIRLSRSPHSDNLIFKGGMLLARFIDLGRETTDLDFLARKLKESEGEITRVFQEIAKIELTDGFKFSIDGVSILSQPHMLKVGYRIKFNVTLGGMRDWVTVDVGIGDQVEPIDKTLSLMRTSRGPIFENEVSLKVYPPEVIFAEKIHAMVTHGGNNSRMKDFHDLYLIIKSKPPLLTWNQVKDKIRNTFESRKTEIILPIDYTSDELSRLQKLWRGHLSRVAGLRAAEGLPQKIDQVIKVINHALRKVGFSKGQK